MKNLPFFLKSDIVFGFLKKSQNFQLIINMVKFHFGLGGKNDDQDNNQNGQNGSTQDPPTDNQGATSVTDDQIQITEEPAKPQAAEKNPFAPENSLSTEDAAVNAENKPEEVNPFATADSPEIKPENKNETPVAGQNDEANTLNPFASTPSDDKESENKVADAKSNDEAESVENPFAPTASNNEEQPKTEAAPKKATATPFSLSSDTEEKTEAENKAAETESNSETNTVANPFASTDSDNKEQPKTEAAPEKASPADNPFAPAAAGEETEAETKNETPVAEQNNEAKNLNPFASTPSDDKVAESENKTADAKANDETGSVANPFASTVETPNEEAPAEQASTDNTANKNANPFGATDTTEETSEAPEVPFASSEASVEKEDAAHSSSTKSDPLASLTQIKDEIENFVALHNKKVADYESQIRALQKKIRDEKELLKTKKAEFRNMLGEIESLTEDFQGEKEPQNSNVSKKKPKKVHNKKKPNQ